MTTPRLPGAATYRGDCTHITGEIKGPLTYGGYATAVAAVHNPATDTTRVEFAHTTEHDTEGL